MQQYNIIFTSNFQEDILSIHQFVSKDNVDYADAVTQSILSYCSGLITVMPYIGSAISSDDTIRKTIEQSFHYTIIYQIDETQKTIFFLWTYKKRK